MLDDQIRSQARPVPATHMLRLDLWNHLAKVLVVDTITQSVSEVLERPLQSVGCGFLANFFKRLALVLGIGNGTPADIFAERAVFESDADSAGAAERDSTGVDLALEDKRKKSVGRAFSTRDSRRDPTKSTVVLIICDDQPSKPKISLARLTIFHPST